MEMISMLPPNEQGVRAKVQLFVRFWTARQKYEDKRPYGDTCAERLRFHLGELEACWLKVAEYQQASGRSGVRFEPSEQFEMIQIISAFVDREMRDEDNTWTSLAGIWAAYQTEVQKLSYDLAPIEFSAACARCLELILAMVRSSPPSGPGTGIVSVEFDRLAREEISLAASA